MEIFYNSSSPGYEEIVSYGPKWWTEYREMNAVYMFEGWLLDILAKKMEQEVKNLHRPIFQLYLRMKGCLELNTMQSLPLKNGEE